MTEIHSPMSEVGMISKIPLSRIGILHQPTTDARRGCLPHGDAEPLSMRCLGTMTPVLVVLLLFAGTGLAQVNEPPVVVTPDYTRPDSLVQNNRELNFLRLPGESADYRIGAGDLLDLEVVGLDNFAQSVRVGNAGEISLPFIGTLTAAELTATELENTIADKLRERKLIKHPEVLVSVVEYKAKPVYVLGEVDRPGQYMMTQQLYLMDALLLAGGLDFTADRYGYLQRRGETQAPLPPSTEKIDPGSVRTTPGTEVIKIDLEPLKEGRLLVPNPALRSGDVILIPERKVELCYVVGDVGRPGAFEIPEEHKLRVTQAIASAGGPTKTAKMSDGILVRYIRIR